MGKSLALFALSLALVGCGMGAKKAVNPDPNHTHADFAIWVGGKKLDFSAAKYMMTADKEAKLAAGDIHTYLHLHDGNGHVIHRHKPGLTFGDFLNSNLGLSIISDNQGNPCLLDMEQRKCISGKLRMFVNGKETAPDGKYVFADGDHLMLSDATTDVEIAAELKQMTDDACLYSRTCPGRGKPPTENCIADPAVPCTGT